jgi:Cft2 family RNA processing exonuclease
LVAGKARAICKLLKKMGHSPWLAIFFLLPFINVVMLYILAKGKWPVEYERDAFVFEYHKLREKIPGEN